VGARFSAPVQTGPGANPASCTKGTGSFPGVKSGQGMTLTPHPCLAPWSRKSRAIPLLSLWAQPVQSLNARTTVHFTFTSTSTPPIGRTACTEPQCLCNGTLYLYLFTYTSTPPMDRTACTEPQCLYMGALYLYLYLYSPYRLYSLYRASMPVQRYTLTLPIPLLPL